MAYYTQVLQPDERVRYIGRLHWILYKYEIVLAPLALIAMAYYFKMPEGQRFLISVVTLALLAATIGFLLRSLIVQATTEIVVTDKRIIHKEGLLSRRTQEMNIHRVETVDVDQSLLGRVLDYGSVSIIGTGGSWQPLRTVASPLALRNAIILD